MFHLNKELPKIEIKDDDFDITVSNQIVTSIITRSNLYKTKQGFRVGSNMSDIEKKSKTIRNELKIAKGSITIGHLGQMIIFNGVAFIDENNNNLVDYIWIKKE
ncbi:hypothetical protein GCM10011416_00550 [Polaribacter pacificus]|uniref:Uncharacterized protein n=1 Tax=Polaribacter pacificus TaxID=1775173 RepID=A0A917HRV6_9FLAO|nr:hypothetical protein GCM10011416_00550 [Polaribacter pacificus]